MSLPSLSIRRPIGTVMLYVGVAVIGLISFLRLPIDLLPDVSFPTLSVWATYRDAAPPEVERFVTEPIEQEVGQVPGVRRVTSRSRDGQSLITLRFYWGTDMDFAALNVRERLDNLKELLPESVGRPVILRSDPGSVPILTLAVTGADPAELLELGEDVFARRLEQLDGVALAALSGGRDREIRVVLDPDRLRAHGLTVREVSDALDRANFAAPGGSVRRGMFRYNLRTLGQFTDLEQLQEVVVSRRPDGATVRLHDLAEVSDGLAEEETAASLNGASAIGLQVYKEAGSNTVRVAARVEGVLDDLREEFPTLHFEIATNQASFVRDAIANVVQALLLGGLLAFLVLFLFLGDLRYPVAVGLAIPISILAAFSLCYLFDVSLNVMSLGGLALGVGMLVDNSIVVVENVFRHRDELSLAVGDLGQAANVTAEAGSREVMGAITASTLTTIAVFGPVLYVGGVAGALFADLSLTVTFSLAASLLVALTLLPVLAARFGRPSPPQAGRRVAFLSLFDRAYGRLANRYEQALRWCLGHRAIVLTTVAATMGAALSLAAVLPRTLMPDVDERQFEVRLDLPVGTPFEITREAAGRLEAVLLELDGVQNVFSRVGRMRRGEPGKDELAGLNHAALEVGVAPGARSTDAVIAAFRSRLFETGMDPATVSVESGRSTALGRTLAVADADLAVRVQGDELRDLIAVAESARARLVALPALRDVRIAMLLAQPELQIEIDRDRAARYGVSVFDVATTIESYLRGQPTAEPFTEFSDKVDIRVQLPDETRQSLPEVLALRVGGVPLGELVEVSQGYGPVEILREDQRRTVKVLADVSGGLDEAVAETDGALDGLPVAPGTILSVGGENEEMEQSFRALFFAFGLALFLVYLILAAQFESLKQPIVVLAAVPLAVLGAVPALWLTGSGVNLMSGIGLVILIGIVVNDAIVKVDFINQRREGGTPAHVAIIEAGRLRLRPILMTTVTTVLGLLPMAFGWGAGADLRSPLAVAVIGGLLSSTILTLLVVPVMYSLLVGLPGSAREPALVRLAET